MKKAFLFFANTYIGLDVIFQYVFFIVSTTVFLLWVFSLLRGFVEWLRDVLNKEEE